MIYDINQIEDEELKNLYMLALQRGEEAAVSFQQAYGKTERVNRIIFNFKYGDIFNAVAAERDDHNEISINSSTIYLLRTLFEALLTDPGLLPEIRSANNKTGPNLKVPFLIGTDEFAKKHRIKTVTDPHRLQAAAILADFCSAFITLHEVGHVIFGHTTYSRFNFGEEGIRELHHNNTFILPHYSILQSWEYDADAVAGRLIVQYIETFARLVKDTPALNAVFGGLDNNDMLVERCAAIVTNAINAMFTYLAQSLVKLEKYASHPHPLHRASYTKDFIMRSFDERETADSERIKYFNMLYFDQFSDALLKQRLLPYPTLTSELADDISAATRRISAKANELRPKCSKWSWVPTDDWF